MAANILKKATSPILCAQLCTVRNSTAEKKTFCCTQLHAVELQDTTRFKPLFFFPPRRPVTN